MFLPIFDEKPAGEEFIEAVGVLEGNMRQIPIGTELFHVCDETDKYPCAWLPTSTTLKGTLYYIQNQRKGRYPDVIYKYIIKSDNVLGCKISTDDKQDNEMEMIVERKSNLKINTVHKEEMVDGEGKYSIETCEVTKKIVDDEHDEDEV